MQNRLVLERKEILWNVAHVVMEHRTFGIELAASRHYKVNALYTCRSICVIYHFLVRFLSRIPFKVAYPYLGDRRVTCL